MKSIGNWLEPFTWEFVTAQNQILCQQKAAHHGPTSDGNTFAAIARIIIRKLNLEPEKEHLVRSLAGHIVAGVASDEEIQAFQKFCNRLG